MNIRPLIVAASVIGLLSSVIGLQQGDGVKAATPRANTSNLAARTGAALSSSEMKGTQGNGYACNVAICGGTSGQCENIYWWGCNAVCRSQKIFHNSGMACGSSNGGSEQCPPLWPRSGASTMRSTTRPTATG